MIKKKWGKLRLWSKMILHPPYSSFGIQRRVCIIKTELKSGKKSGLKGKQ